MAGRINPGQTAHEFATQWSNPSDVFSVLLILGGDVINRALAQLAGTGICPVAFSFGEWLSWPPLRHFYYIETSRLISTKSRLGRLRHQCRISCIRRKQAHASTRLRVQGDQCKDQI